MKALRRRLSDRRSRKNEAADTVKTHFSFLLFVALNTLFYGAAFIFSDFYGMPFSGLKDFLVLSAQWLLVVMACFAALYLLSVNRFIFAFFYPPLTVLCALLAYFRYTANITLSAVGIELALVNDARTIMETVTLPLLLSAAAALAVSVCAVWTRFRRIRVTAPWLHTLIALALMAALQSHYRLARPINERIPYNIYTAFSDYISSQQTAQTLRPAFADSVHCQSDSLTVVFILGETVRARNLQINGYPRATTPQLAARRNVVSLPRVYSQYGFTHSSVPYLLTRADRRHPERAYTERSFFDILKRAGYQTAWIANQESVETYAYFMKEADTLCYVNAGKSVYVFSRWLDEDILPHYRRLLKSRQPRKFMLLHTIGSHWWYNAHFTPEFCRWTPVAQSRVFSSNTHAMMVNSYDNTILYSDHFWNRVIQPLESSNAVVIYLSDHAENLGEDGLYGHGAEHPALHYPGCWIWFSDTFAARYPHKVQALRRNASKARNSSFLFHTVIGAADVSTSVHQAGEDVFSAEPDPPSKADNGR